MAIIVYKAAQIYMGTGVFVCRKVNQSLTELHGLMEEHGIENQVSGKEVARRSKVLTLAYFPTIALTIPIIRFNPMATPFPVPR